nr:uncharacterized protein LOC128704820 [Cherax quadricarinatus]
MLNYGDEIYSAVAPATPSKLDPIHHQRLHSFSALQAIKTLDSPHHLVLRKQLWLRCIASRNKEIIFYWVPVDVQGNEQADSAARSRVHSLPVSYRSAEIVQLANQDYGVCIKRADDYCGIIYDRNTNDGDYSFTLSGDTNTLLPYLIGTFEANSRNEDCTTDYVVIPGGRYTMYANDITTFPADRYCGLGFPYTVTTTAQPFVLYFKTDGDELLDNSNRGFSLNYRQIISCV